MKYDIANQLTTFHHCADLVERGTESVLYSDFAQCCCVRLLGVGKANIMQIFS